MRTRRPYGRSRPVRHGRSGFPTVAIARPSATLLESYEGWGEAYLSNILIEIFVEEKATLERVVLIEEPNDAISVTSTEFVLAPDAAYRGRPRARCHGPRP